MKRRWEAWLRRLRTWPRGRAGEDHPSVEMLAAYHDDQLSPETDEEIQEHFVDCTECPELMLDLDRFTSPQAVEAAKRDLSDTWVDTAWRRLRLHLAVEAQPAQSALRWLRGSRLAWSLTALLTPCALGLWLRVGVLTEEIHGLEAPQLNPPWWNVEAAPTLRGVDPTPPEVTIPAGARQFLLVFFSSSISSYQEYRLVIRNGEGKDVWAERGLRKSAEGTFVVTVSRRFLPAGLYFFRVTGIAGDEEEPFTEEFPLRLVYL